MAAVVVLALVASSCAGRKGAVFSDDTILFNCIHEVEAPVPDSDEVSYRFQERTCRINVDGTETAELYPEALVFFGPAMSPGRDQVAIAVSSSSADHRERGAGFLVQNTEGEEMAYVRTGVRPSEPAWTPSGDALVFGADHRVIVAPIDGSETEEYPFELDEVVPAAPAVSPDGLRIAVAVHTKDGRDSRLAVIDRDSGVITTVPGLDRPRAPVWSPGEETIAVEAGAQSEGIDLVDLDRGEVERVVASTGGEPLFSPSWSPDGSSLAYVGGDTAFVVDLDRQTSVRITSDDMSVTSVRPTWSPNGDELAVAAALRDGQRMLELVVVNVDGTDLRLISESVDVGTEGPAYPAWS